MTTSPIFSENHFSSTATSSANSGKHHPAPETLSTVESESSVNNLAKRFGPLLDIDDNSIISLALKIRNQVSSKLNLSKHDPSLKHRIISRLNGSYNLVFIVEFDDGMKYVVRLPGTGWGNRFTDIARKSFESQIMTLRLICNETTIPIPEVYAFDASLNNELGAPWMVTSFLPGSTVAQLWFDEKGPTPLEERRQRALETIAEAMSQLQKFKFNKIGSLELTDQTSRYDKISIGPLYCYGGDDSDDDNDDNDDDHIIDDNDEGIKIRQSESFNSSASYMSYAFPDEEEEDGGSLYLGALKLNKMMLSCLPRSGSSPYTHDPESFVLNCPDFDSQNVLIDEKGNLTGLLDWDNAQTYPRWLGYCVYPGFINRDWDPTMYQYPAEYENSPEELARYREIYLNKMTQLLCGKGDVIFIPKSHIFEALQIATYSDKYDRLEFMRSFVKRILPDQSDLLVLGDLAIGELESEVMEQLERGVEELLSVKPVEQKRTLSSIWRRLFGILQVQWQVIVRLL